MSKTNKKRTRRSEKFTH